MTTSTESFAVLGMSCQHCIDAVTAEVGRIPGVEQVEVDLGAGMVTVTSTEQLDHHALSEAIDEAGFELVAGEPAS